MGAKKLQPGEYKFTFIEKQKYIRIDDILRNTDWSRRSIERRINSGVLQTRKVDTKLYILWDSYQAWING